MGAIQDGVVSVKGPGFSHSPARLLIENDTTAYVFTHRGKPVEIFSVEGMSGTIRRGSVHDEDGNLYRWYAVHVGCSYKLAKCRASTSDLVAYLPEEDEVDDEPETFEAGFDDLLKDELIELAEARDLPTSGTKADLIARLSADAQNNDDYDSDAGAVQDDELLTVPSGVIEHGSYGPED
jgi:hypothetical protein